jgi:hypothetical protein
MTSKRPARILARATLLGAETYRQADSATTQPFKRRRKVQLR